MKRVKQIRFWVLVAGILVVVWLFFAWLRPVPELRAVPSVVQPTTSPATSLPWPAATQSALGAQGFGLLAANGAGTSAPMASLAKIITALAVLKQKPLALNQPGPTITLSSTDVDYYRAYLAAGGSVVAVTAGEQISQYQALQAMLLPSANNLAESLAVWAFGSMDNYLAYVNQYIKTLGLSNTHMADASGFDPGSISTAQDLVKLGLVALDNPVLSQIVSQDQANVPIAGTVHSTNWLLGTDGIIGIKTGNTDQAGGCFLFASNRTVSGRQVTLVGAVLGAPNLNNAIADGRTLADASDSEFELDNSVKAGQVVGSYTVPWGGKVSVAAKKDLAILAWKGQKISLKENLDKLSAPVSTSKQVGSIVATIDGQSVSTQVVLDKAITKPSLSWRLFH